VKSLFSIFFILFFIQNNFGQEDLFLLKIDSLNFNYRTGGNDIDSLSDYHSGNISLNPGSFLNHPFSKFQNNYTNLLQNYSNQFRLNDHNKFVYSSMPHLGFSYSFGSKSLQMLHAEYHQFFSKKTGLNIEINRSSLGDMMRNGSFKSNDFKIKSLHQGRFYKNYTLIHFLSEERGQNGGLDSAQSVLNFPLEFLKVRRDNAKSELKNFKFSTQHYFNLLKDSLSDLGFQINQNLSIQNRKFYDNGNLSDFYQTIYIDSFSTRDQFQLSKLVNGAGIYLKQKAFFAEFLAQHYYWKFYNLNQHSDTNEIALKLNLEYKFSNYRIANKSSFTLIGSGNEWFNHFSFDYLKEKYKLKLKSDIDNLLPTVFQRNYYSNTNFWKTENLSKQFQIRNQLEAEFVLKENFSLFSGLSQSFYRNNYFFIDSKWRNDTLNNISLINFNLKSIFKVKSFIFHLQGFYNHFSKEFDYLPKFDFRSRIAFNKKLFEAKKMNFILAFDFSYQSLFRLKTFYNDLDLFVVNAENNFSATNRYKLDFFTGFQIDDFRFYIKAENINYIWDKSDNFEINNYPISPFYLRLGLTWDFFN
jgi:hypothetical protein